MLSCCYRREAYLPREHSGSVVEYLTHRHCVVSLSKNINPSLVLVQPRKTRPYITERLLMGSKESNQTKQTYLPIFSFWHNHTGQCKRTGGCYNELVVAFLRTGGGLKGKKICATISALYQCIKKCSQFFVIKFLNKHLLVYLEKTKQSGNRFLDVISWEYDNSCA